MRCRWIAFVAVSLAACSRPTELVVIVDSDLAVPSELDEVVVTITGPSGAPIEARQPLGDGEPALPLTLGVTPSGDSLGPIDIVADGLLDGTVVVTRSARTSLIAGQSLALYMFLPRACRGVTCTAGQTCTENGCATTEIDPEDLPPWNGTIPGRDAGVDASEVSDGGDAGMPPRVCDTGSDCDDGIDCTRDTCTEGACANLADDTLCTAAADGRCDPADGCQYATCSAATCVAGPCQTAVCVGDQCDRTNLCASDQTCCNDACVIAGCDDANPCTDDACGATGCENTPNTMSCDDGTFCNGAEVCGGGTCASPGNPCSGSAVCDETANVCTGCVNDADCGPPVLGPWDVCTGFAGDCGESGTRSRGVTVFTCNAGTCIGTPSVETEACARDTDGISCGATQCGGYGACGGFSDTCDESGVEVRTCNDFTCVAGSCQGSPRDESRACGRSTSGVMCAPSECGVCVSACAGFADTCDQDGTCPRECFDYSCGTGTCNRSMPRTETITCTRMTEGQPCDDGLWCTDPDECRSGACRPGFDLCGGQCICDPARGDCYNPDNPTFICAV